MKRLNKRKKAAAAGFILPAVIFLLLFSIVPMAYSFGISFFQYNTAMSPDTIHVFPDIRGAQRDPCLAWI